MLGWHQTYHYFVSNMLHIFILLLYILLQYIYIYNLYVLTFINFIYLSKIYSTYDVKTENRTRVSQLHTEYLTMVHHWHVVNMKVP